MLDSETSKSVFEEGKGGAEKEGKLTDKEIKKRMPAFYDFINTLDLNDFDKRKS